MATPVVTVASGGLPVVDVTATAPKLGLPVTEALAGRGTAITKVAAGGVPVTFVTATGAPGGGFNTPADIPGLLGWWDASVTPTIVGGKVTQATDQSGGGRHMTNIGASGPQHSTTGLGPGNKAHFIFQAASYFGLHVAAFPMGTGNTLTFWSVNTLSETFSETYARFVSYSVPGVHDDFNKPQTWVLGRDNSTTAAGFNRNSINAQAAGLTASPAVHIIIGTIDSSGFMTNYVDGVVKATATSPGNWATNGDLSWGRNGYADNSYMSFQAGELGVATSYNDATVVAALYNYLKNKWGL